MVFEMSPKSYFIFNLVSIMFASYFHPSRPTDLALVFHQNFALQTWEIKSLKCLSEVNISVSPSLGKFLQTMLFPINRNKYWYKIVQMVIDDKYFHNLFALLSIILYIDTLNELHSCGKIIKIKEQKLTWIQRNVFLM